MTFKSGLAGKVAIVTGGSRGIGRAIVETLAGEGVNVTFFFKGNQAAADEVVAAVLAAGGQATALQVDVSDAAACAAAVETVAERCERIDILVNNAGIVRDNLMARAALACMDAETEAFKAGLSPDFMKNKFATAVFYAGVILPRTQALADAIHQGVVLTQAVEHSTLMH